MNERKSAQLFDHLWEDSQQAGRPPSNDAPETVRGAYGVARRLAGADYSPTSRVRQHVRQRLMTLEISERRAARGFEPRWLSSAVRLAAWVAVVVILALSLIWALNTLIPHPVPSVLGTPSIQSINRASANLGKLAYLHGGDIWVKTLTDGEAQQLTNDGLNTRPRWSPSGEWLAYRHGDDQLWVIRTDGDQRAQLPGSVSLDTFAWSPVADQLAYVNGMKELLVVQPGSEPQVLVSSPERQSIPYIAWSPDGAWIAFQSQVPPLDPVPAYLSLWKVSTDGGEPVELFAKSGGDLLAGVYQLAGWTSGGRDLIFWGGDPFFSASLGADGLPLYSIPADGGDPRQLAGAILLYPDYVRPNPARGREVAIVVGGGREAWMGKSLVRFDGAEALPHTSNDVAVASPAWSPDGERIAYAQMPDSGNMAGGETARQALMQRRLWVVDASTGHAQQLTSDTAYRDEYPLWSEDGSTVLFVRMDGEDRISLWTVPSGGGDPRMVVDGLLTDDLTLPESGWFGYYGHMQWDGLFDWWRGQASSPAPTEEADFIPEDQAIEIAIQAATQQNLHAIEGPENIRADFIEALELWRVTMDGTWTLTGGPLPTEGEPTPKPVVVQNLTIEINARTGELIRVRNGRAAPPAGTPEPTDISPVSAPSQSQQPVAKNPLPDFPLNPGTTWVYSYVPYEPLPSDPAQIITATYLLTETVTEFKSTPPYFSAKVEMERTMVGSSPDWNRDDLSGTMVFWYVIEGNKVYKQQEEPLLTSFNPDTSVLEFQLPLIVGAKWCPQQINLKDPERPTIQDCSASGEWTVAESTTYETPAGQFSDCFRITESINSGGTTRWLCNGFGIVAAQYDHAGTRFGFEQKLIRFLPPSPVKDPEELYPELVVVRDLLDRFYVPLRSLPGWIHKITLREVPEGNGLYGNLTEWTGEDWLQLDGRGYKDLKPPTPEGGQR